MGVRVRPGRGWPLHPMRPIVKGFHKGLAPGDVPVSAFQLTGTSGSMVVDNTMATIDFVGVPPNQGYYYFNETPAIWFHYVPTESGTFAFSTLATSPSYNVWVQAYSGLFADMGSGLWEELGENAGWIPLDVIGGTEYWFRIFPDNSNPDELRSDVQVAWTFTPRALPVLLGAMLDPAPPAPLAPMQQVIYPETPLDTTTSVDIAFRPFVAGNSLLLAVSSLAGPPDYNDFGVLTVSGVAGTWTLLAESPDFNDIDGTTPVDNKTYLYLGTDLDTAATTITIDQSAEGWLAVNVSEWPISFTLTDFDVGADRVYFTGGVPTELALEVTASAGDFVLAVFGPDRADSTYVNFVESPGVWTALTPALNADPYVLAFYAGASSGAHQALAHTVAGTWDAESAVLVALTPATPLLVFPLLDITPAAVTIAIGNGTPDTDYVVTLDGGTDELVTGTLDVNGSAYAVAVPLPPLTSGDHTLTVTSGDASVDITFTVLKDAVGDPSDPTDPTTPVPPTPVATARWQIHDTLPSGGFETFVFEINPDHATSAYAPRAYTAESTTAPDGQALTWQAARKAASWSFDGYLGSQEQLETLAALFRLNRQVWIIDDLGQYYIVTLEKFDARPVRDTRNPYRYQYTASVLLYYLPFTLGNFYPPPALGF